MTTLAEKIAQSFKRGEAVAYKEDGCYAFTLQDAGEFLRVNLYTEEGAGFGDENGKLISYSKSTTLKMEEVVAGKPADQILPILAVMEDLFVKFAEKDTEIKKPSMDQQMVIVNAIEELASRHGVPVGLTS